MAKYGYGQPRRTRKNNKKEEEKKKTKGKNK